MFEPDVSAGRDFSRGVCGWGDESVAAAVASVLLLLGESADAPGRSREPGGVFIDGRDAAVLERGAALFFELLLSVA